MSTQTELEILIVVAGDLVIMRREAFDRMLQAVDSCTVEVRQASHDAQRQ